MIGIIASSHKKGSTPGGGGGPVIGPTVKIPVVKIYNHTLTGNEMALVDDQASNVQVAGASNQAIQPAGQNSWWNDIPTYLQNPVLITQDNGYTGAFRTTALPPEGINYTLRFNGLYNITKVCLFLEPKNSGDKGHVIIKSGTPYNFTNVIADLHDDGSLGSNKWFDFDVSASARFINLSITNKDCGIIREIVCYGNLVGAADADTWTVAAAPAVNNFPVNKGVGMNIVNGMGVDYDGTKYDEGWKGGTRTFGAGVYVLNDDGSLKHSSGTYGAGEAALCERIIASGGDQYYCYGSLVCKAMAESPADGTDWASQKPIDVALGNAVSGQRLGGKLTFNEIADSPASYARAADILRRLAEGNYSIGIRRIEPDNEKDGSFKGAGFMYPEQLAAMMSAYWDGHNGTVTYWGNPVGIRNYPGLADMQVMSPAFSYISARYLDCMKLWWETKRAGFVKGVYPFDALSVHAYPGTFEVQFSGAGEAVYPERADVYNLPAKLDVARNYAWAMGNKPVANTELGFDTFYKVHPHPEAGCGAVAWGGSFVAIKSEAEDPAYHIQADWLLRSYLLHISKGIPLRIYWLAEQSKKGYGCGTFIAAGLLEFTDDHGIGVPTYLKKPSYNVVKKFLEDFSDYHYVGDVTAYITASGSGNKAILLQNGSSNQLAVITWKQAGDKVTGTESANAITAGSLLTIARAAIPAASAITVSSAFKLDYDSLGLVTGGATGESLAGDTIEERPQFYKIIATV